MAKLTLNPLSGGYASNSALNTNNDAIEDAIENTLSRDGTTPNQMEADLDLNSNDILNANSVAAQALTIAGVSVAAGDTLTVPDAVNVPFTQAGTGAILSNVDAKLKERVSVKDFGAVGNGVADDTASIQAALDSGSKFIYCPEGTYSLSSALDIGESVYLIGTSRFYTLFKQTTLNAKILNMSGSFCKVAGVSFIYDGTPTSGATAIHSIGNYNLFDDFIIRNSYIGMEFTTGVANKITNFEIFDYESIGLFAHGLNDLFVARFIINAGNATRGALGGIRLVDKVEAFICNDGDILLGVFSVTTDATVYAQDTRPAYNNFSNVFFDSSVNGTSFDKMVETDFIGCWWSGGRSGGGNAGCILNETDSLRFTNGRFFNNGGAGCSVTADSKHFVFNTCKFESNSVTSGSGVSHGLDVANNTNEFIISDCVATNGLYTGTQGYGIFIGTGCDKYQIVNSNVEGNITGGIADNSTNTNKTISGNVGYVTRSKGTGSIAIGQTIVSITHGLATTPLPEDISVVPYSSPTISGVTTYYITAIGATTFQIAVNTTVAVAPLDFAWTASIKGA